MLQDWVKYKGVRVIVVFKGRGLAGGGKGAGIGALAGAGAGTAVSAAKKEQQLQIPSESLLEFRLEQPVALRLQGSRAPYKLKPRSRTG
jgi:hypothetical protein